MQKILSFLCIPLFTTAITLAAGNSQPTNNELYTKATAYPASGLYQGVKRIALIHKKNDSKIPAWDGYCPPCTLTDKKACAALPCQTHNLLHGSTYQGIEVKGNQWMKLANQAALASVKHGGGPFGAVIVQIDDKTGTVIRYWVNHNQVVKNDDPTAHAEIATIRAAAKQLGVINLGHIKKEESKLAQPSEWSHVVMYSSAEPCPMCLAAIYWAGIRELVFSATRYDAAVKGVNFSDKMIYEELKRPYKNRKKMIVRRAGEGNSLDAFNYYKRTPVKRYGEDD